MVQPLPRVPWDYHHTSISGLHEGTQAWGWGRDVERDVVGRIGLATGVSR